MTVVDATAIVGAVAVLAGLYWDHRKRRKEQNVDKNVSWASLTSDIRTERDNWKADSEKKDAELEQQATAHAAAIAALQARHDAENVEWARQLAECQKKVQALYGELYQLQKLLPPNLRPGSDNAPGG